MFKKSLFLAAAMTFASIGYASAACTQDEAAAKGNTLATQLAAFGQKDAQKLQAIMPEYTKDAQEMANKAGDLDAACAFFDKWIEKTK
ncbi:hypothetical protein FACS1894205_4630 [Alphaproteobacteria bacterium]|nr:hypothetical protein FACS1894205_4630 [Alphaproteobacteria bacterium]